MGKIVFISGGARSGKSQYAVRLAKSNYRQVLFIATACASDKEMQLRIKLHKKDRPCDWKTIEEPKNIVSLVKDISKKVDLVIIDCLTLFISNLMLDNRSDVFIERQLNSLLKTLKRSQFDSILISGEVGLGVVPDNHLARRFRDLAGRVNQNVASMSDEAYFIIAGLPLKIK